MSTAPNRPTSKSFKFWVPGTFEKGQDKEGKEKMKFKGIASTIARDSDKESLNPKGFDLNYFLNDGYVNWNHQSKKDPSALIGEPTHAEITKNGELYVETELWDDSDTAKKVWELGKVLEKSKSKKRLGFSIEGKILERDLLDPTKINKALITGLAITPSPKNKTTFADIMKGEISEDESPWDFEYNIIKGEDGSFTVEDEDDEDEDEEEDEDSKDKKKETKKSLSTESGAPVTKESIDKKVKKTFLSKKDLEKSEVYEKIFSEVTLDVEKAEKIYLLIENIEKSIKPDKNMEKISYEAIDKAYAALGLQESETTTSIEKGESGDKIGMKNSQADTTPSFADNFGMYGSENGYSMDMVMGMYSGVSGSGLTKSDYIAKAIEKGVSNDFAEKAFDLAIHKGILTKADSSEEMSEKKKTSKEEKESEEMSRASEEMTGKKVEKKPVTKKSEKEVKKSEDAEEGEDETFEKGEKTNPAILDLLKQQTELIKGFGSKVSSLEERLEKSDAENEELSKRLEKVAEQPVGRRSVETTSYIKKDFSDDIKKAESEGLTIMSVTKNAPQISSLAYDKTLEYMEKGHQDSNFFSDFVQQFEAGHANNYLESRENISKIEKALNIKLIP